MMPSVYFDPDLNEDQRRQRLYAGDIVILSATPDTRALVSLARGMLEDAFAPPSDLERLPEDVVRLYDDGSATTDRVLHFGDRLVAAEARTG